MPRRRFIHQSRDLARIVVPVFAALCLFFPAPTQAQLSIVIDTLDAAKFPTIRAKVKVRSGNATVRGLTLANFTVFEDGLVQAPITGGCDDTTQTGPVSVMLVIDKSNSMGPIIGSNAIVDARRAASSFVDRLSVGDEAALISFNDVPSYDQAWTTNKAQLKTRINAIRTSGGTAVWDAIITGTVYLRSRVNKKVMIVLTDGVDTESNSTFNAARDSVVRNGIRVYSIGLGNNINATELRSIATVTGGRYFNAPSGPDLDQIYIDITNEITSSGVCELRYQSKLDCLNGSMHRVEIEVRHAGDDERDEASYTLPYDSSTFSYISLAVASDISVDAGAHVAVPLELLRVSTNRPPTLLRFDISFDPFLARLDSISLTPLTTGYTATTAPIPGGARITLQGAIPVARTGVLANLHFTAADRFESAKTNIGLASLAVGSECTIASTKSGLLTVNGVCHQAVQRSTAVAAQKSMILSVSPNPFNPATRILYRIGQPGTTMLRVYDTQGNMVADLRHGHLLPGEYERGFDAPALPSGVYMLLLDAPDGTDSRLLNFVK